MTKKEKIIIFSGKLNKNKGFEIFGNSIIEILDKFPDWKALFMVMSRERVLISSILI